MNKICVYCGSSRGTDDAFGVAATEIGERLARSGISVVYGGSSKGIMGIVADAALHAGGEVIGVIPKALVDMEVAHNGLTELHVVNSMHERKTLMADLSDGFVALPGGYGTLEEIVEMLTWGVLQFHAKPCGLLNVNAYFDNLLAYFDHATEQGFLRKPHRDMLLVANGVDELMNLFAAYQMPEIVKLPSAER